LDDGEYVVDGSDDGDGENSEDGHV